MANVSARGRQKGVIAFTFRPFIEGVIRAEKGIRFDEAPTKVEEEQIAKGVQGLRETLKLEKNADLDDAPKTRAVVDLFVKQLRTTMVEIPKASGLRDQLENERMARIEAEKELEELRAQLAKAKAAAKKR